jgi:hypothetical protein
MRWRKSSFSQGDGQCVEVASPDSSTVLMRNSRHPEAGTLAVPSVVAATFIAACKSGEYDTLT